MFFFGAIGADAAGVAGGELTGASFLGIGIAAAGRIDCADGTFAAVCVAVCATVCELETLPRDLDQNINEPSIRMTAIRTPITGFVHAGLAGCGAVCAVGGVIGDAIAGRETTSASFTPRDSSV